MKIIRVDEICSIICISLYYDVNYYICEYMYVFQKTNNFICNKTNTNDNIKIFLYDYQINSVNIHLLYHKETQKNK